ncbi:U2 small nuclear ribonucleoprotein auxiliary factor 35 kDa subunit-related protein 2-like [Dendronephthya gigantea]|uniref:U2 small nuclear ribonucleoprotein auxiliary factor 35 kDa subunit-related protein 2-like n=1 Tax=Dendronephthya gigantea TaxID=151771 RepID=UPI00106B5DDB|nr:U2 small nuclear ribonucleoprotein auxiliary factor 35 kDa subunit-related protein 2-like [Dendronephthya gigantea]
MEDDASTNAEETVKKLSHRLFKRLLQKEKRKWKRQKAAEARKNAEINEESRQECDLEYKKRVDEFEADREKQEILERENNEKLWLQREAEAQAEFARKKLEEERRVKQKEEQEKAIKLEWERQQEKEKEEKERKEKSTKDKEEALFREIEKEVTPNSQSGFHNPVAPAHYGTEKDAVNCSFFLKTGACRFGERCSRQHPRPSSGVTLLIPAMYADIRHIESALDIADRDTGLEFDEQDAYKNFLEFYDDVHPEFEKSGRLLQFKVCCNYEPHLRGNVYVQYTCEEDCQKAFADFNGRWYAGRQLSCEFSPVTNWKSAICGLFAQNRCPRGKNCNFLHVYRNPDDWSEQRSENLRHVRNGRCYYEERDRRHSSDDKSRLSSDRNRSRNGERDSYRYDTNSRDRRRRHRSRSQSPSDDDFDDKHRRRRRQRKRSKSRSSERDRRDSPSRSSVANRKMRKDDVKVEEGNGVCLADENGNNDSKTSTRKSRSPKISASPVSDKSKRRRKSKKKHKKHKRRSKSHQNTTASDEST